MELNTSGMEFASEMVVKASLKEMDIAEVPTTLSPDGRTRPPHLNTWRDGWRHLRFLMAYSPKWLYLVPGFVMIAMGLILSIVLLFSTPNIGSVNFDIQTLLYTSLLIIIGFQFIAFYFLSIGLSLFTFCRLLFVVALMNWQAVNFGQLSPTEAFRITIPSCTLLVLGLQIMMYSFFWHILKVPTTK